MSIFPKDPGAEIDYTVDWSGGYLSPDEDVIASEWQVQPAGGLFVASSLFTNKWTRANIGGGVVGRLYRLTNRITTSEGRSDERSLTIRVLER